MESSYISFLEAHTPPPTHIIIEAENDILIWLSRAHDAAVAVVAVTESKTI